MSAIKVMSLYENQRQGRVKVAVLYEVDGDVQIDVLRDFDRARVQELLGNGIGSSRLRRRVRPSEGELFVQVLQEELRRSTMWTLMPDEV